ncbi:MAG: glycoside hydrolase family 25 protein [Lachnospiraceae bacterium]|nr:glycoside hydrolase family 25 protein [Lachnospiraceae bacterium]
MKLDGNDNKISPQMGAVVVASVLLIFVIVGIAVIPQLKNKMKRNDRHAAETLYSDESGRNQNASASGGGSGVASEEKETDYGITSPDELDFWNLYPEVPESGKTEIEKVPDLAGAGDNSGGGNGLLLPSQSGTDAGTDESDPSKDGKHTAVTLRDGSTEWVTISQYLPKNEYDFSNLVCKDDRMEYYLDGKKISYIGIDVSKYQDYIDFNKVKKDGIAFVMIRVGLRGYGDGQVTLDDYFFDNIKRATDAGLKVGVYFTSQAVNTDEAAEEANLVLESIGDYHIDYPIAFDMRFVKGDTARIESLSVNEKTNIAKTFLDIISAKGYNACILGTKEWFIKEIEMSKLTAYDFWLEEEVDLPDYPYKFSMWQYKKSGTVDGVSGVVNLNISFVDYTEK